LAGVIAALILAAGGSSRMGNPKQLLPHRGRPLILHAVDAALEAGCRPVIVTLGARAALVREALRDKQVELCINEQWRDGIAGSIRLGVAAIEACTPQPRAALLMTCDQPFISAEIVGRLIDAFDGAPGRMVASEYAGTVGVPALFERGCFARLAGLRGDSGAKSLLLAGEKELLRCPWPEGACDIDTPDEYAGLE
jgi:molybdenum cofactor cytidylyltransferase